MNIGAYLVRSALCLIFFYLTYRVLLHNKCRYAVNRFYLVGSFLVSFIIPFITIDLSLIRIPVSAVSVSFLPDRMDTQNTVAMIASDDPPGNQSRISLFLLVSLLYFSGILVFMIRYGLDLFRLIRMIRKSNKQKFRQYTLVKLEYPVAPFSFFRYIFVYDRDVASDDFRQFIITHEQAHIRNWHSLDSMFLGLGQIVQWFNPVIIFYKKAVIALHEFSADREVIENTESLTGYQQKILKYAYIRNNLLFTSNLSNTMIKKRFIMMTKQNQGRHTAFRVVASAIVAAFLLLAFSNGDKIGVKSLPDRFDLISSLSGPDDNASLDVSPVKDTLPHSGADQTDSPGVQNREYEEQVRILSEEINQMKQYDLQDSLSCLPHVEFFVDPGNFRQHMGELPPEFVERHLRHAESQLRLAEEQQMLAERLKPLLQGHPVLPDTECLRKMAEAQVRLKHLRPMIEGHGRLEHLHPMIDEPFIFPPAVHPYPFDGNCPDMQDLQLRIEKELRNPEHQHLWEQGSPGSMEEKDLKMLEKQKEWQEQYRREMDKQRDQMEKTRRQLMDDYHKMMRKYRKEIGNN